MTLPRVSLVCPETILIIIPVLVSMNNWSSRSGICLTLTIWSSSRRDIVRTPLVPRLVRLYPSLCITTSPSSLSTSEPLSSSKEIISPDPSLLRLAMPNLEMVRTLVSKSSVTIIPITRSPSCSFIPDTP